MEEKENTNTDTKTDGEVLLRQIRDLAQELLADEAPAAAISFNLVACGLELALTTAPSPEHAFSLVSAACSQVSRALAPEIEETRDPDAADDGGQEGVGAKDGAESNDLSSLPNSSSIH